MRSPAPCIDPYQARDAYNPFTHPHDSLWVESLLCQSVIAGQTKGYKNHPQVTRWREHPEPLVALGQYLATIQQEATTRGYNFNRSLILQPPPACHGEEMTTQAQAALLPPLVPTPPLLEVRRRTFRSGTGIVSKSRLSRD